LRVMRVSGCSGLHGGAGVPGCVGVALPGQQLRAQLPRQRGCAAAPSPRPGCCRPRGGVAGGGDWWGSMAWLGGKIVSPNQEEQRKQSLGETPREQKNPSAIARRAPVCRLAGSPRLCHRESAPIRVLNPPPRPTSRLDVGPGTRLRHSAKCHRQGFRRMQGR